MKWLQSESFQGFQRFPEFFEFLTFFEKGTFHFQQPTTTQQFHQQVPPVSPTIQASVDVERRNGIGFSEDAQKAKKSGFFQAIEAKKRTKVKKKRP